MWCASKRCVINIQLGILFVFFVLHFFDFFDPTVHLYKLQTKIRRDQCPCSFLLVITYEQIVSSRNTIYRNSQEPRLYLQFCEWEDRLAACLAHSSFCNQFIPPFWTLTWTYTLYLCMHIHSPDCNLRNLPHSFLFWHFSSFLKTQWTKRILNYLIENTWKIGLHFAMARVYRRYLSFKCPSQNAIKTFVDFLTRRLLKSLASKAQDLEQLS